MERSLEKMKQADLVLYLFDARDEKPEVIETLKAELDKQQLNYLLVANKIDERRGRRSKRKIQRL